MLYTDGLSETLNISGEAYEEARLEELLKGLRHAGANEICTVIYDAMTDFRGETPQFDGLTLVVLKKK